MRRFLLLSLALIPSAAFVPITTRRSLPRSPAQERMALSSHRRLLGRRIPGWPILCARDGGTIFNVRVSVPGWADASVVSDILLDLGFMSAFVSLDGPDNGKGEAYLYTDKEFDLTGQLDISQQDACVEALSSMPVDAFAIGSTLAEIFGGDGPWPIELSTLESGYSAELTAVSTETCSSQARDIAVGGTVLRIEHDNYAAFGDGGHSSTRLCLKELERIDLNFANVLDFGAGTAVLGLAALKLGARRATLVENDPASLAIAAENIIRNGEEQRTVLLSSLQRDDDAEPFDVAVANMPANTVMAVMPEILRALIPPARSQPGRSAPPRSRYLILAGFPEREGPVVRACVLRLLSEMSLLPHEHTEISFQSSHEAGEHPCEPIIVQDCPPLHFPRGRGARACSLPPSPLPSLSCPSHPPRRSLTHMSGRLGFFCRRAVMPPGIAVSQWDLCQPEVEMA